MCLTNLPQKLTPFLHPRRCQAATISKLLKFCGLRLFGYAARRHVLAGPLPRLQNCCIPSEQSLPYLKLAQNPLARLLMEAAPNCRFVGSVGSAWQAAVVVPILVTAASVSALAAEQNGFPINVTFQTQTGAFTSSIASAKFTTFCGLENGPVNSLKNPEFEEASHGQPPHSKPFQMSDRSGSRRILGILTASQVPAGCQSTFGLYARHRGSPAGTY